MDDWSKELPPSYQRCRDKGHDMEGRQARKAGRGFWRLMKCTRCTYEYQEDLDHRGRVTGQYGFHYPDGYLAPKGVMEYADRGDVKAAVRLVAVRQLVRTSSPIRAAAS